VPPDDGRGTRAAVSSTRDSQAVAADEVAPGHCRAVGELRGDGRDSAPVLRMCSRHRGRSLLRFSLPAPAVEACATTTDEVPAPRLWRRAGRVPTCRHTPL
jgi:hypothetical protein